MNNFYNPYMTHGNYITELQNMRDRIDSQIQQVQQQNLQTPTNLTQNFQLAPNSINNIKTVDLFDDVQKEIVVIDTYFFNKDMTNLWIKNSKGDIRTFNLKEVLPKDEKDILIENLQRQIKELKGGNINGFNESNDELLYEKPDAKFNNSTRESVTENKSSNVSTIPNSTTTKRKPRGYIETDN